MSDLLFKSFVATSLAAQNVQLRGVQAGLSHASTQLNHLQHGVDRVSAELTAARERSAEIEFWRDQIFHIRKTLELFSSPGANEGRAYFFCLTLDRYLGLQGIQPASFTSIADKEYWHRTMQLMAEVTHTARERLGAKLCADWEAAVQAVSVRDHLRVYLAFRDAKVELEPFVLKRDRIRRLLAPLDWLGGWAYALGILIMVFWFLAAVFVTVPLIIACVAHTRMPAEAFWGIVGFWLPIVVAVVVAKNGKKLRERLNPIFPARVHEIMSPLGWNVDYNVTIEHIDERLLEFRTTVIARGMDLNRIPFSKIREELETIEKRVRILAEQGLAVA